MIAITVNSTACYLLTTEPADPVKIGISRLTERHAGKTRREERRILGATLRWKLNYTAVLDNRATAQAARLALRAFDNRPILCPFWPAAVAYGQPLLLTGALRCTWEPDFTNFEIHTTPAPTGFTPSAVAKTAPVLWGRFDQLPDPAALTTEIPSMPVSFVETGPKSAPAAYAVAPAAGIVAHAGPALRGTAYPLLDFDVDYASMKAGGVDVQVDRQRIGFGRDEAETYYPQTPRGLLDCTAVFSTAAEAVRLIATFHACAGAVAPLWFPSGYAPTRLTANPSASDNHLAVEDASLLGGHPHIILRDFYGANVARTITASTLTQLTLDAAPGDLQAQAISLQLLLFGRFTSDELQLSWGSSIDITAKFAMTELPPDYGAPAGEIYGKTLGQVGAPIFLFEIADQVGGAWWWTNYESAIALGGHTYASQQIAWDKINQRLNLDDGKVTLTMDSWEGNPFMRLLVPRRGQQITVKLKEWESSGTADPVQLWDGYASSASADGKTLKIPVAGEGLVFDLRVPRRADGPTCPWIVYGAGCNLAPTSKAVAVTAQSQIATLQFSVSGAGTRAASYFAGGWMQRGTPGDGSPTYGIVDNTAAAGGVLTVTLDMTLLPAISPGEAWTLYPACNQTWDNCGALGNTANFGGQRNKPASNPAFVAVKTSTAATSKK